MPLSNAGSTGVQGGRIPVGRKSRLISTGMSLALLPALSVVALGDPPVDEPPPPNAPPAAPEQPTEAPEQPPAEPSDRPSELRSAVEGMLGASVHGTFTNKYRLRTSEDGTDQDIQQFLDLRVGDDTKDHVSGALFVRSDVDLDRAHEGDPSFVYHSLDDTFSKSVNTLLYTAYTTIRPQSGPFESYRVGRQYAFAAETFHVDGASATTRPLVQSIKLKVTAYGGVPVHFYESNPSGDWLGGLRVAAEPWKGGTANVDYTHVQDKFSTLSEKEKNDLAALSMWQTVAKHVELYGQFSWLDGPRDGTLRATANVPESGLLVQASYYRLLETKEQLATEFDPYTNVIQEYVRYQQGDLRATKGFGDHFDVTVGGSVRRLLSDEQETTFNHDTRRLYVTPSVIDLPWKGTTASATAEQYSGDGQRQTTWGLDASHQFGKSLKLSAGSDYSLYTYGAVATEERTDVRTAYARARFPLNESKSLMADVRYTWEKDDVETFHVLTLAVIFEF
jgi:hypothetical protein